MAVFAGPLSGFVWLWPLCSLWRLHWPSWWFILGFHVPNTTEFPPFSLAFLALDHLKLVLICGSVPRLCPRQSFRLTLVVLSPRMIHPFNCTARLPEDSLVRRSCQVHSPPSSLPWRLHSLLPFHQHSSSHHFTSYFGSLFLWHKHSQLWNCTPMFITLSLVMFFSNSVTFASPFCTLTLSNTT